MTQYRIHRRDPRNLVIQKFVNDKSNEKGYAWRTVSYHGNSLKSLISGLLELIMSKCIPDDDNLLKSLDRLELEYIRGIERVEEIIKNSEIVNL